jgi:hypothetical protein
MSNEFAKYLYESNYPYSLEAKPSFFWAPNRIPVLSAATAVNITSTTATPQCVLTF